MVWWEVWDRWRLVECNLLRLRGRLGLFDGLREGLGRAWRQGVLRSDLGYRDYTRWWGKSRGFWRGWSWPGCLNGLRCDRSFREFRGAEDGGHRVGGIPFLNIVLSLHRLGVLLHYTP